MPPRILIPLIIACALFMENLDSTVLSPSLPAIAVDLGEDPIALKLAVTSYLLSLAIFIPASGWVADRFGARLIFRLAIIIFVAGSILCGLSSGIEGLIIGRIIQGMGGAMMVPVGRLVILRSIAKTELVGALAWLTVPALIGPILGPLVGGFITTYVSWRWIFWINVPIGFAGVYLASRFLPDVRAEDPGPFDARGFGLLGAGLAATVVGSTSFGLGYLPLEANIALLAGGLVLLGIYVWHAGRLERPILDLSLLRIATFRASILGGSLFRIGVGATPFLLPLMLQFGFGLNAFQSGMLTFVAGIGALAMKISAQPILRAFGFRNALIGNSIVASLFIAAPAFFTEVTPVQAMMAALLIGGFFRSLQFTAVNALAYADIDQARMSRATGFTSVVQQLSVSFGVSIGAFVLEWVRFTRGDAAILADDFPTAFLVVAGISLMSIVFFLRLPPGAGDEMSGYRRRRAPSRDPVQLASER